MKGFGNQNKSKEDTNKKIYKSKDQIMSQALSFHAKGNFIEAEKLYKNLIDQGFQDYRVSFNRGIIFTNRGDYKSAEKLLNFAIHLILIWQKGISI